MTGEQILPGGSYLELISFTHPESHYPPSSPPPRRADNDPWANKANGWLAYAFLGAPYATPLLSAIVNARLQAASSDIHYYEPVYFFIHPNNLWADQSRNLGLLTETPDDLRPRPSLLLVTRPDTLPGAWGEIDFGITNFLTLFVMAY